MLAAIMALLPVENADEGEQDADEQALGAPSPALLPAASHHGNLQPSRPGSCPLTSGKVHPNRSQMIQLSCNQTGPQTNGPGIAGHLE